MKGIRVVVVEASAKHRAELVRALQADRDITVIGEAGGAMEAIELVQAAKPDVVALDLQTPDGGGQLVVEQLMAVAPVPILILSTSALGRESEAAVAALVAGAVDVLPMPTVWGAGVAEALRSRVRICAGVAVIRRGRGRAVPAQKRAAAAGRRPTTGAPIVAIGASTGGPAALARILTGLGGIDASVLIVQHLHADFVGGLVSWMDRVSPLEVELAEHDAPVRRGVAYIAPSGTHLRIGQDDTIVLDPTPATLHRPSVDQLFSSLADRRDGRTIGVLLTGMGDDGAAGLLALRRRGHVTIVQDEETSAVFGMPRAAQRLGAAAHTVPLARIAATIARAL